MDVQTALQLAKDITKDIIQNGIPLRVDPLYSIIRRDKVTSSLYKEFVFFIRVAAFFAFISFLIGFISIFYEAKGHLQIMGYASTFHILGAFSVELFKKKMNRYLLLAAALLNLAFFAVVQIFLVLYIMIADSRVNPSKRDFKNETFLHIILIPWIIVTIVMGILFLFMLMILNGDTVAAKKSSTTNLPRVSGSKTALSSDAPANEPVPQS